MDFVREGSVCSKVLQTDLMASDLFFSWDVEVDPEDYARELVTDAT